MVISTSYLLITIGIKLYVNTVFDAAFTHQQITIKRFESRPAPLNTVLWAVNAESTDGFYVGYYSLLDTNQEIDFFYFPKNIHLIKPYEHHREVQLLMDISNQWFTLTTHEEGIVFNDLRFGQRTGWTSEDGDFVFSYLIKWDKKTLQIKELEKEFSDGKSLMTALWNRILGKYLKK